MATYGNSLDENYCCLAVYWSDRIEYPYKKRYWEQETKLFPAMECSKRREVSILTALD